MRSTLSPLSLGVVLAAACSMPEGVRFVDRPFPGSCVGENSDVLVRLVDDLTGEPVAGAELFLVPERKTPIAGEFWFEARGVSDSEGFVHIARPYQRPGWGWQVVRDATHGVATRTGWQPVWRLGRGFDVPVRVVDWLGQPAAGAHIGFCGGCGHTPDLVNAVADANGNAVLRGIDPQNYIRDLYVQHPGLHHFYNPVEWRPGESPMVVQCNYAPPLVGRVVDRRGEPVAGAFVCGGSDHRGPWGRTAADGTFTVLGAAQPTYPHHVVTPEGRDVYFDTSAAWPVTLRLPDLADPKAHEGTVEDRLPAPLPIAARAVRVVVEGAPGELLIATLAHGMVADEKPAAGHVLVPLRGPFVLVASVPWKDFDDERRFAFADSTALADPIVVRWTPAVHVVGRAVDGAGRPVAVAVRVRSRWAARSAYLERDEAQPSRCADGAFDLAMAHAGTLLLEVAPLDAALRPRLLWVVVPPPGAAERVDLGDVVVGGAARLRVVDASGAPLPQAIVGFARPGWQQVDQRLEWPLAADATWRGPDLREGDTIVVRLDDDALPFCTVLRGAGPWTIAAPAGELELEIVGEGGAPVAATVVIGDHGMLVDKDAKKVRLRGLPAGRHRAWISAPGYRTAILDVDLAVAPRTVRVQLPVR